MAATGSADDRIKRWFGAAIDAVDPALAVQNRLSAHDRSLEVAGNAVTVTGQLLVVAIGKAALPMARGASSVCGELISGGIILTKEGHLDGPAPQGFTAYEAAHPIPDHRGFEATQAILRRVSSMRAEDVVLVLLSGGGSALLEAPVAGVSLEDMAVTTNLLLRAGAPINDLNAVRTPLSAVKGGGLRAKSNARFVTVILSDVLGNDTSVIASGPTVPTRFTPSGAVAALGKYGVLESVPESVRIGVTRDGVLPDPSMFTGDIVAIIGDNVGALQAFAHAASLEGLRVDLDDCPAGGEASELAIEWVERCVDAAEEADLYVRGGEATVTVKGDGQGGRNTEFVLSACLELERRGADEWVVASLATDGQDAMTGVAGAIGTSATIQRARERGLDPEECLRRNASLEVFRAAGGCVETGPTGTNVNDIYVALRTRASKVRDLRPRVS